MGENLCKRSNKELISKIYQQLTQLKKTKKRQPIKKWAEDLDISQKKIYRWPKHTWKDPQHLKEMQIKTTIRYHLKPVRMAIIKNSKTNKCWIGCGRKGTLLHSWWECKLIQPLWRIVLKCFLKIRNKTTIWHKQYHYWAYTLKKTIVQKDTCTPTFNVALFTIART